MTKINKIAIILMLLVFCALCSFGLVGCRSKDPNDPSYWYGTYKYDESLTEITVISDEAQFRGSSVALRQDGIDLIKTDGTTSSFDFEWGTDDYRQLQWELENMQHDVVCNKKGFHMGHGTMQWVTWEFVSALSEDTASTRQMGGFGYGAPDRPALHYKLVLPISLPDGDVTIRFWTVYVRAQ